MRIDKIKLYNYRIYKGENEVNFNINSNKNISLIAGKNGFGKTTFLSSLIWAFYGALMAQVEDKYRSEIRNAGGYEKYRNTLLNKVVYNETLKNKHKNAFVQVEIHLVDVMIPSIPCKKVIIRRTFNLKSKKETLKILIDGHENELTKEVGYDVFINDFILPREIAKFFFFDSEKIVSLAEAKSISELRSLSSAYSEVLGIKKYEDLKVSLKAILTKLKRSGVTKVEKEKLNELIKIEDDLSKSITNNKQRQEEIENELEKIKNRSEEIQEKLIREGNEITLEELKKLIAHKEELKKEIASAKSDLGKLLEIAPLVVAGSQLKLFINQLTHEANSQSSKLSNSSLVDELQSYTSEIVQEATNLKFSKDELSKLEKAMHKIIAKKTAPNEQSKNNLLLDYDGENTRSILATFQYIKESFKTHFESIIKSEKNLRQEYSRVQKKIRKAEKNKSNPYAKELNAEKESLVQKAKLLNENKQKLVEDLAELKIHFNSNQKVLSEYEKNFKLVATDQKKYKVSEQLLVKIKLLTAKIKEEKKYALQKSILQGLKQLMHKDDFIEEIKVRIENDIMDIDLIDKNNQVINKNSLSKGEQQLYATALLKALVDESGINFPVFIDSPLQKFDKQHSNNIIKQFYPNISSQVVLFPLLEKELTISEYEQLKPNLTGVYLIENNTIGSTVKEYKIEELFNQFNFQHVYTD